MAIRLHISTLIMIKTLKTIKTIQISNLSYLVKHILNKTINIIINNLLTNLNSNHINRNLNMPTIKTMYQFNHLKCSNIPLPSPKKSEIK